MDNSDESDDEDDDTEWDIGGAFVFKGHSPQIRPLADTVHYKYILTYLLTYLPSIAYCSTRKIWIFGHLLSD